jgi:hypothetical protein
MMPTANEAEMLTMSPCCARNVLLAGAAAIADPTAAAEGRAEAVAIPIDIGVFTKASLGDVLGEDDLTL